MTQDSNYIYIDSDAKLADFCAKITGANYCAIDTEFVRESTYYPILALIQIAADDQFGCIDPLAVDDFGPLTKLLASPSLLKVFHSPSQDLEVLYQKLGEVPTPVFDTQLASGLLGYTHQISYAELVRQITGVELDKKYTRTDWSRRPLSQDQLDYAMDDVRYLMPVYEHLREKLKTNNRQQWIEKDFQSMTKASNYEVDMSLLWKRLKGGKKLKGERLQIASDLCQWRETVAQQRDRPRRWIVKDEALVEIARQKPVDLNDLSLIPDLGEKTIKHHGEQLLQIVSNANRIDSQEWPHHDKVKNLNVDQLALGDCLMAICRTIANDNDLALATLATRNDIDNLIIDQKNSRLSKGWRLAMAGENLLNFIHGQSQLNVVNQSVKLVPV